MQARQIIYRTFNAEMNPNKQSATVVRSETDSNRIDDERTFASLRELICGSKKAPEIVSGHSGVAVGNLSVLT